MLNTWLLCGQCIKQRGSHLLKSQRLPSVFSLCTKTTAAVPDRKARIFELRKKEREKTTNEKTDGWTRVDSPSLKDKLGYYAKVSKFRLTGLVTLTATAGYLIAPGPFSVVTLAGATIGTMLCSASANSLNQFMEVPYDCQMSRTRDRVLVRGLLRPQEVVIYGSTVGVLGVTTLAATVNPLTAVLGGLNIFLYAGVYTPSKRLHIANTWIGSVVGAIPPLMGWAAATGGLDLASLTLAGVLYSWQFPHFNALSWSYRADYSRAGYKMMSVTDPSLCRRVTLRHGLAQILLSILIPYLGITNWSFLILSLPVNVYQALLCWEFYKNANSNTSKKLFRFTLLHLPIIMFLLIICKSRVNKSESNLVTLSEQIPP